MDEPEKVSKNTRPKVSSTFGLASILLGLFLYLAAYSVFSAVANLESNLDYSFVLPQILQCPFCEAPRFSEVL